MRKRKGIGMFGTGVMFALATCMVFSGVVAAFAAPVDKFDTSPILSPTKMAGAWYTDRYAPAAFEKATFDGGNRLHLAISSADSAANRPAAYAGSFYNTQGRKFDLNNSTFVQADLFVGPDWETNARRSDLWATAVDSGGAVTGYPTIGFSNGTGFEVFDPATGVLANIGFPTGFAYGRWYTLRVELDAGPTGSTKFYIDSALVYTSPNASDPDWMG